MASMGGRQQISDTGQTGSARRKLNCDMCSEIAKSEQTLKKIYSEETILGRQNHGTDS